MKEDNDTSKSTETETETKPNENAGFCFSSSLRITDVTDTEKTRILLQIRCD